MSKLVGKISILTSFLIAAAFPVAAQPNPLGVLQQLKQTAATLQNTASPTIEKLPQAGSAPVSESQNVATPEAGKIVSECRSISDKVKKDICFDIEVRKIKKVVPGDKWAELNKKCDFNYNKECYFDEIQKLMAEAKVSQDAEKNRIASPQSSGVSPASPPPAPAPAPEAILVPQVASSQPLPAASDSSASSPVVQPAVQPVQVASTPVAQVGQQPVEATGDGFFASIFSTTGKIIKMILALLLPLIGFVIPLVLRNKAKT